VVLKPKKFDFAQAKALAAKAMKNPNLEAVILGAQGAGKSYALGTLGVKTLHIYGTRESHGPRTAAAGVGGDNIVPFCIDYGIWPGESVERQFSADESFELLEAVLRDTDELRAAGYGALVCDGLAVLEAIVKETSAWKKKCLTAAGKHNTYKETEATQDLLGQVISWMKQACRELDMHLVVTGILDVKDTGVYGEITEASPRLGGYGLAETMNQHFGDVLVVGKMTRDGVRKWKFQFLTELTKVAKDENGGQKRAMNFNPRLSGYAVPEYFDADFAKLAAYKKEKASGK